MSLAWHDAPVADKRCDFGPLALIAPILQRFGIADIIDRHLPPDPQVAFSHGRVLCLNGNDNNHTAIRQQCEWLFDQGLLTRGGLLISDRGTFSVEHVARLYCHDC